MFTILMNNDGSLVCTTPKNILYQNENLVDKFHFILPKIYKEIELEGFTVSLKYVNAANIAKVEILKLNNNNYKENYLEYLLPITTEFTKFAGNIKLYLTMSKIDTDTNIKYLSNSGETIITIEAVNNYFVDDSSFQGIDKRIMELQKIAEEYNKTKADNIERENNNIYLTSNGNKIGNSISVEACDPEGIDVVEFTTAEPEDTEDFDLIEF